jgi:oligopeptide/dipeptide ABC transporter, ATP-binding protein, C-terminal domain
MANKILEVRDLRISFKTTNGKVQAVRDINFDLFKGETLAIVGESGSGKSVTSRAILGILAGNSIVEGGTILYGDKDLLRISEEDFHKIRGDKIAMIFQDPLSSLNPIIRVGKQLTEAMLLKNKSSRRRARREFNRLLKLLGENMKEGAAKYNAVSLTAEKIKTELETFDKFCIMAIKLQDKYNIGTRNVTEAKVQLETLKLNSERKQKIDYRPIIKRLIVNLNQAVHPYTVTKAELEPLVGALKAELPKCKSELCDSAVKLIFKINTLIDAVDNREEPNFFTAGYYAIRNPEEDIYKHPIPELNKLTREYLDREFMLAFIEDEKIGLRNSYEKSIELKKRTVAEIERLLPVFTREKLIEAECRAAIKSLTETVEKSIDRMETNKDSTAYTFGDNLSSALDKYFDGIKANPAAQVQYEHRKSRYDKVVARGKQPDWTVTPAALVDLELAKDNIALVLTRLGEAYKADIAAADSINIDTKAIALVDFMKEKAEQVVYKISREMAKYKAIKLMDEVGIDSPERRYRQFPFEFSGGMRQRIVIAIALAANPDILICDEPTTALDVTIQSQILELINNLKQERHLSVIFITHDLGVVANMADRVAVMYAGKIVEYGTSEDIFCRPAHPYTWALLSSMPDLDTSEKLEAIPGTAPNMIYPPVGDAFAPRNKYALEIDFEQMPPMFEISDTHSAATWLLHPDAPKVEPPKIVTERIKLMMAKKDTKLS